MIHVLTYDAPHRKTQDLLIRLKLKGYSDVHVFATPWKKRKNFQPLIPHRPPLTLAIPPETLCQRLAYNFSRVTIDSITIKKGWLLIGGAGLLPESLVVRNTIINAHPAYLPYVRGLDALKWAIYKNEPIGVTTHLISKDCDAGQLIHRAHVPLYPWDSLHSVAQRQYDMEVDFLASAIESIKKAPLTTLSTELSPAYRRMPHSKEQTLNECLKKRLSTLRTEK